MSIKQDLFENAERDLCYRLDMDVYMPTRQILNSHRCGVCGGFCGKTYPLGHDKEDFKTTIHNILMELKKNLEEKK